MAHGVPSSSICLSNLSTIRNHQVEVNFTHCEIGQGSPRLVTPVEASIHCNPDKVWAETKHRECYRFSRFSKADNATTLARTNDPKTAAESALVCCTAYDMKLNLAHLSCHAPTLTSFSSNLPLTTQVVHHISPRHHN